MHFHLHKSIALAGLAAAAFDIEGETAAVVAALAGRGRACKEFSNGGEEAGVGRWIAPGGSTNRTLVDTDQALDMLQAFNGIYRRGLGPGAIDGLGGRECQGLVDEGGLSAARDAGDTDHEPDGNVHVHIAKVVASCTSNPNGPLTRWLAVSRQVNSSAACEVVAGERARRGHDLLGAALGHNCAAMHPGTGPHVHHHVGCTDGVLVVFDHDYGIPQRLESAKGGQEAIVVALVKSDGRFIQDIEHTTEPRTNLAGQPNALRFSARERGGASVEAEIGEPDID